ncbi:adenosine deaminase [Colwellia sp. 1_MG-2023]|uniref:adenosine deaminase n=1 Tax=unclassified Colwellia TaxID=196834 RepID=UPI001C0886B1|nr:MULTISPECIES: adenosine deaminase [unclassified Colwellia]MBU2923628.1 adenosine deaminase [Colwellia sp. C2M11]MDO6652273.1 adenosine deaminase [Colwellia sp. 3_MG-2023]MDO6664558.1 adenosine deaminase [Colwellia sp. 2_MG-2023]MDO6688909.1 adenosine deaminase [Colwellia sp. 1_MG-2023]
MQRFIENMPKAELHVHIEGTLEPELSFALAKKNKVELSYETPEALISAYDFNDLPSFLTIYYAGMNVLIEESDFYQLTYQYLSKARSQEILYVEIFFDPQAHTVRGISFETIITGIHKAQVDAEKNLGIKSQLIMCFLRDMSAESAMQHLVLAKPHLDWLVGVGLDSDERNNPPSKFYEVFSEAKKWGLKLTMHCDVNQKNTLVHIKQCINEVQVDRIDHGINSLESNELCDLIKEKDLGLTVCPVSNQFVVQSLTSDEIHQMLAKEMLVTINSDDPAYFRAYLNENLIELQKEGKFSQEQIITLVSNAFKVAWIDDATKEDYLQQLQRYVSEYKSQHLH